MATTGHAIKHLIQFGEWQSIGFIVIKDVTATAILTYLIRLVRTCPDTQVRMLAIRSVMVTLMVSFMADAAITLIRA